MRHPFFIPTLLAVFVSSSCGLDPTMQAGGARAPAPPPETLEQDVPVITQCRVVGSSADHDPAAMKIFRHDAGAGALRLSIEKLPMTCADRVSLKARWQLTGHGRLTLDVRGDRYQHCLCSVDFMPFDVAVPADLVKRLEAAELVVTRDVRPEAQPLRATTIGALPTVGR